MRTKNRKTQVRRSQLAARLAQNDRKIETAGCGNNGSCDTRNGGCGPINPKYARPKQEGNCEVYDRYLALNAFDVPAGESRVIRVSPKVPVDPACLLVDSSSASSFQIDEITVGVQPVIFGGEGGVSAGLFSEVNTCNMANIGVICSDTEIEMTVRNIGPATADFRGAIKGVACR